MHDLIGQDNTVYFRLKKFQGIFNFKDTLLSIGADQVSTWVAKQCRAYRGFRFPRKSI